MVAACCMLRRLVRHLTEFACSLARDKAGNSTEIKTAMIPITTRSSTRENPRRLKHRMSLPRSAGIRWAPCGLDKALELCITELPRGDYLSRYASPAYECYVMSTCRC